MADLPDDVPSQVRGRVKWFDLDKGFGFVVNDDGGPEILLHENVLRSFGQASIAKNARIMIIAENAEAGMRAVEVLEIKPPENLKNPNRESVDPIPDVPFVAARIKWFSEGKGFGFANVFGDPEDVFVSFEVLHRCCLSQLKTGEAVAIKVVDGPRGKMAVVVRNWDFV